MSAKRKTGRFLRTALLWLQSSPTLPRGFSHDPPPVPGLDLGQRHGEIPESWLRVPGTDCGWPLVHHAYISYRDACGDLRSAWEASRFRWVKPSEFPGVFEDWARANPVGLGPNWASGLEVAVRAINWVFLHDAIRKELDPSTNRRILAWLAAHGRHLAANPEQSPPNHGLGWALGLFTVGGYLRGLPGTSSWLASGQEAFVSRLWAQFLPDGTHSEGAPGYGAFALEMGLCFLALCRSWGIESGQVAAILENGLGFLANIARPDGSFPVIGDFDDGGVLRPVGTPYADFILGLAGDLGLAVSGPRGTQCYPHGGFLIMREGPCHLVARTDDDPSLPGGHRHSDLFSFELWMDGPVVVDPGVFLYTGPCSRREDLRAEDAHNLAWRQGARMHARDPKRPFTLEGRRKALRSGWEAQEFVASHDLFGQVVERRFRLRHDGVEVADTVGEEGDWRMGLTLAPGPAPEITPDGITFARNGKSYLVKLLEGNGKLGIANAIFCPAYGRKIETHRLVFTPESRSWRIFISFNS